MTDWLICLIIENSYVKWQFCIHWPLLHAPDTLRWDSNRPNPLWLCQTVIIVPYQHITSYGIYLISHGSTANFSAQHAERIFPLLINSRICLVMDVVALPILAYLSSIEVHHWKLITNFLMPLLLKNKKKNWKMCRLSKVNQCLLLEWYRKKEPRCWFLCWCLVRWKLLCNLYGLKYLHYLVV